MKMQGLLELGYQLLVKQKRSVNSTIRISNETANLLSSETQFFRSSMGGSMAKGFELLALPLKKAVLISKEDKRHFMFAMVCRMEFLPSRVSVGASRAISVNLGS